jgi:hypothetical protein
MFTKEAVNVIEKHDDMNPLFLLINHMAPHAGNEDKPMEAKPENVAKFSYIENETRRTLAGELKMLGKVFGVCEEIANHVKN